MPVLLLVSIVVLLAGVLASQHRLPLALPVEQPVREPKPWRLGLAVLAGLAVLITVLAAITAIIVVGGEARQETAVPTRPTEITEAPTGSAAPPTEAIEPATELPGAVLFLLILGAVGLIAVAVAGIIVVAISARRAAEPAPLPELAPVVTTTDTLARAAEMGLAAMNVPGQDPRTAIIACYVAMEAGLSFDRAAAPLISDTPMEVLARAFERGALHDASARELVSLFEEARFSPHAMLEWQRMRAEQLLRIVLADLQGEVVVG